MKDGATACHPIVSSHPDKSVGTIRAKIVRRCSIGCVSRIEYEQKSDSLTADGKRRLE